MVKYLEEHPEKEDMLLVVGFVIGWLGIIYISIKPYPMDYVDGVLLVDPGKMMKDGYGDIGSFIGFCAARFIEKRYIDFKPTGLNKKSVLIGLVGIIIIQLFRNFLYAPIDTLIGIHWGHFVTHSFVAFYVIALYPAVIKFLR